jgi:hypothetical protein
MLVADASLAHDVIGFKPQLSDVKRGRAAPRPPAGRGVCTGPDFKIKKETKILCENPLSSQSGIAPQAMSIA